MIAIDQMIEDTLIKTKNFLNHKHEKTRSTIPLVKKANGIAIYEFLTLHKSNTK